MPKGTWLRRLLYRCRAGALRPICDRPGRVSVYPPNLDEIGSAGFTVGALEPGLQACLPCRDIELEDGAGFLRVDVL